MNYMQLLVLVWKNWILHRRHYFVTAFEIVSPVFLCLLLLLSFSLDPFYEEGHHTHDITHHNSSTYPLSVVEEGLLSFQWRIINFAPNYPSVVKLMNTAFMGINVVLNGYPSEQDIRGMVYNGKTNIWGNIIFYNFNGRDFSSSLQYEIILYNSSFIDPPDRIYYEEPISERLKDESPYRKSGFLKIQSAIDLAYIAIRTNRNGSTVGPSNIELMMKRLPVPHFAAADHAEQNLHIIIIPFFLCTGLLFFFLVIVKRMADEKNNRAKVMMKTMGMTTPQYWGSAFFANFTVAVIICIIITYICAISVGKRGSVTHDTPISLFLLILLLYCASSLLLCFIISTLFTRSAISVSVTVVFWVSTIIIANWPSTLTQQLFTKMIVCLIPNFAIKMIFILIYYHIVTGGSSRWDNIMEPPLLNLDSLSVGSVIIMMLLSCVLYTLLLLYLDAVWPWQPGIPKSPLFFLDQSFWCPEHNIAVKGYGNGIVVKSKYFEEEKHDIVPSVVIYRMTKEYGIRNKKAAVDDLSLNMYHGQITVLVGRNGAGKTTTINMLSGNLPPTSGTATINGCDIVKETNAARSNLGICPEYTVLYDTLTVEEHLKLFAGLKGMRWWAVPSEITYLLRSLQLLDKTETLVKNLTGGMQRKLSLANAMIGSPEVLILDEPTTGLDPESRRCIWNLLENLRSRCTILVTTHHMEEADALGDQIAIMVLGHLQCCGSSLFLKNIFDAGYHLRIEKAARCQEDDITQLILRHIPEAKIMHNSKFELTYFLSNEVSLFKKLFQELENSYQRFGIESCGIDVTTMDEVFVKVSEMYEEHYQVKGKEKTKNIERKGALFKQHKTERTYGSIISASLQQMTALFIKRAQYAKRNLTLLLYQIVLPLITILLFVHFDDTMMIHNLETKSNNFDFNLCNTFEETKYGVFQLLDNGSNTQTLANVYKLALQKQCLVPLNVTMLGNLEQYILSLDTLQVMPYVKRFLVGASLYEHRGYYYLVAWFNGIHYHMDPVSINLITNTLLRFLTNDINAKINLAVHLLSSSTHASPYNKEPSNSLKESLNVVFLPVGLTILSSSFVLFPVHERVSKVKLLQRMCGISGTIYWSMNFLWDFSIYIFCSMIMIIPFYDYYRNNGLISLDAIGGIFLLLVLYGVTSIPLTYLASFIVTTPSGGFALLTVLNMFVGITGTVTMVTFMSSVNENGFASMVMWFLRLFPNFSTTWGIKNIYFRSKNNVECSKYDKEVLYERCKTMVHHCCTKSVIIGEGYLTFPYYSWDDYSAGKECFALLIAFFIWSALIILLETNIVEKCDVFIRNIGFIKELIKSYVEKQFSEDNDVCDESRRVDTIIASKSIQEEALVIHRLAKDFSSLHAVNSLSLAVHKKECFGLLGVDGAGKTTTFRLLTGDLVPSSGNAYIEHANIQHSLQEFQKNIGYCPQADALLDRLNAREMLQLFAHLRGVPKNRVESNVNRIISICDLDEFKDKETYTYSGGTKRKLCLAIALIGAPPVILLDEPTSGVDPVSRRRMWEAITTLKDTLGLTFVLTSHSMDECENLCDRIAIMVNGEFRCLGSMRNLKSKFGKGYTIMAKLKQPNKTAQKLKEYIIQNIPDSHIKGDFHGTFHYHTTNTSLKWSEMFLVMEKAKEKFDLQDYIVSGTRLEQIFLTFARDQRTFKPEDHKY